MLAPREYVLNNVLSVTAVILTLIAAGCASAPTPQPEPPARESVARQESVARTETESPRSPARAEPVVAIKPSAPERYVVQEGDTLWDLSNTFLEDPWYWPEIWHVNRQIENPHLIYPGDVITLFYVGGRPGIQVTGGPRVDSLSPAIRYQDLDEIERGIPIQAIGQFIIRPKVVTREQLDAAPYIVGSQDNRLIYGSGDEVYVRNLAPASPDTRYSVFRPGKELRDPVTGELLGYEAILVGDALILEEENGISTIYLQHTTREALQGDRLLPVDEGDRDRTFFPHPPVGEIKGYIISLFDALSQVGQHQVVVLNVGERNGIEKGHVLAVHQSGRAIRDPFARDGQSAIVTLPDERTGVLLVFRTFDKVSYGLVMGSDRPIRIGDSIQNP